MHTEKANLLKHEKKKELQAAMVISLRFCKVACIIFLISNWICHNTIKHNKFSLNTVFQAFLVLCVDNQKMEILFLPFNK